MKKFTLIAILIGVLAIGFVAGAVTGSWWSARAFAKMVFTRSSSAPEANQRTPSPSPSGKYVLTVPIERDSTDRNLAHWRVTISDTAGKQLYKDDSKFIGTLNVYWCWDSADRVWLYNSDDGAVYFWQLVDGRWQRSPPTAGAVKPPDELFPDYARKNK